MTTSYILDTLRTPRGRGKAGKGALSHVHPQELLAQVLRALAQRGDLDPAQVDDVIVGAVAQVGDQGANVARNTVLAAGWPDSVPGVALNRFCASGLQSVHFAAMAVASGAQDLVVAGGVESMSRLPIGADGGGQDGGNVHLRDRVFQIPQGISADLIATLEGFSREQFDAVALRSQQNAAAALADGRFNTSIVPAHDPSTGKLLLAHDEFPRPDTTAAGLAALKPSFVTLGEQPVGPRGETLGQLALAAYPRARQVHHLHTAGNSGGIGRCEEVTRRILKDNKFGWAHVDVVLTTGGASRMPMIRDSLKKLSGRTLNTSLSPDQSFAHGAAYYAGMLLANQEYVRTIFNSKASSRLARVRQESVNARSLGILIRDETGQRVPHYLIPANTALPVSRTHLFGTVVANQSRVHVRIVESGAGADRPPTVLGDCIVTDLPPNLPEGTEIEVTISYDHQARVHVSARELSSGRHAEVEIVRQENLNAQLEQKQNVAEDTAAANRTSRIGATSDTRGRNSCR